MPIKTANPKTLFGVPLMRIFWLFIYSVVLCLLVGVGVWYFANTNFRNDYVSKNARGINGTSPVNDIDSPILDKVTPKYTDIETSSDQTVLFNNEGSLDGFLAFSYPEGWFHTYGTGVLFSYDPTIYADFEPGWENIDGIKVDFAFLGESIPYKESEVEVVTVSGMKAYSVVNKDFTNWEGLGTPETWKQINLGTYVFRCGSAGFCGFQIYGDVSNLSNVEKAEQFIKNTKITIY